MLFEVMDNCRNTGLIVPTLFNENEYTESLVVDYSES